MSTIASILCYNVSNESGVKKEWTDKARITLFVVEVLAALTLAIVSQSLPQGAMLMKQSSILWISLALGSDAVLALFIHICQVIRDPQPTPTEKPNKRSVPEIGGTDPKPSSSFVTYDDDVKEGAFKDEARDVATKKHMTIKQYYNLKAKLTSTGKNGYVTHNLDDGKMLVIVKRDDRIFLAESEGQVVLSSAEAQQIQAGLLPLTKLN